MDQYRRRFHEALLDLAGWMRQAQPSWYSINILHPERVRNDNPQFGSGPLFDRDMPPHVSEAWRLLDSAPRELQRIAATCYLEPGPKTLTGRAERVGIPKSTLCRHRNRLLDWLVSAAMGEDAPRVSAGR